MLIIGPGPRAQAEKLVQAVGANPAQVLYDEAGTAYDTYTLHRVFLSLIQQSAAFMVDKQGVVRYGMVTNNPMQWLNPKARKNLLATLDRL